MKNTFRLALVLVLASTAAHAADPVVPLHDGLGDLPFPIATESDAAQRYFHQGLRLGYAVWWSEARRSFEEAIRQDPDAPMPYWGRAWAYGPYINYGNPPERDLETAREALDEAWCAAMRALVERVLSSRPHSALCRSTAGSRACASRGARGRPTPSRSASPGPGCARTWC